MTFNELNADIQVAQSNLEAAIRMAMTAQDENEIAKINLIKSDSLVKKARLDLKLYDERIKSLREISYNLRKEASI